MYPTTVILAPAPIVILVPAPIVILVPAPIVILTKVRICKIQVTLTDLFDVAI